MPPPAEPGSADCPPGHVCIPCTTGKLKVTVYLRALCWDTDPDAGEDTPDPPLIGASVAIMGLTEVLIPPQTNASGEVLFEALAPGDYSIRVDKPGFVDVTDDLPKNDELPFEKAQGVQKVEKGPVPKEAIRVLRRERVACLRKHAKKPGGTPGTRSKWWPVFWSEEPWPLVWRDIFWTAFLAVMAISLLAAIPFEKPTGYILAAWALGYASYLTVMIFGEVLGTITVIAAAATFALVLVIAISQTVAAKLGFGEPPSPTWFALLTAEWIGFGYAYVLGRTDKYFRTQFWAPLIGGFLGAIAALVAFVLLGGASSGEMGLRFLAVLLVLIGGFVCGLLAAMCAHNFRNEGKIDEKTAPWLEKGYLLPYSGEHYCVQGYRGFISHGELMYGQQYSYDWEFPVGWPILCAKDGHIVKVVESHDGSRGYNLGLFKIGGDLSATEAKNNELHILHRDGTVAQYHHLRQWGVKEIDPRIPPAATPSNPLHVYCGQQIAAAGNVGISMHSHLHFMIVDDTHPLKDEPSNYYKTRPAKFDDPDTASHGNRCYTFRKYRSSNVDRGPVKVPADSPPFKPGGKGTDGKPKKDHEYLHDPPY